MFNNFASYVETVKLCYRGDIWLNIYYSELEMKKHFEQFLERDANSGFGWIISSNGQFARNVLQKKASAFKK